MTVIIIVNDTSLPGGHWSEQRNSGGFFTIINVLKIPLRCH